MSEPTSSPPSPLSTSVEGVLNDHVQPGIVDAFLLVYTFMDENGEWRFGYSTLAGQKVTSTFGLSSWIQQILASYARYQDYR